MQKSKRVKWQAPGIAMGALVIFSTTFSWAEERDTARQAESSAAPAYDFSGLDKLAAEDPSFGPQVFRLAAQSYLRRKKPADAVAAYRKALKISPSDSQLLEETAAAELSAGQTKEALGTWDKIMASRPDDVGNKLRYADFLMKAGEGARAVEIVQGVAAKKPEDVSLRYWIADAYQRQNKPAEAARQLKAMRSSFPKEEAEIRRRLGPLEPAQGVSDGGQETGDKGQDASDMKQDTPDNGQEASDKDEKSE